MKNQKDGIEKLSRKEAIDKLKRMRDIIWPHSQIANGERDLHRVSAFQVYEEIKDLFDEPMRMLPKWEIDPFFLKKIEPR
jgi:hypothetical protein